MEKKFDCGIDCLIGTVDKKFCQSYLKYEILSNNLLGEYSEDGEYSINDDIKNILVGCAKKITKKELGNCFSLLAVIGGMDFNFEIKTYKEQEELVSELYLIEEVKDDNKEFCHVLTTFIAEYRDYDNIYFIEKMYKVFNLFDSDDEKIKDFDQEKYCEKIIAMLKLKKGIFEDLLTYGGEYYENYIKEIIKMLEKNPNGGKFVLKLFKEYLGSIKDFGKNKGDYFKAMKRLNQLILSSKIKFTEEERKKIEFLQKEVFSIEEISYKKRTEKKEEHKESKPSSKKSSKPSKPKSKKSKPSKGKPKNKKKPVPKKAKYFGGKKFTTVKKEVKQNKIKELKDIPAAQLLTIELKREKDPLLF